jgi:hypothetical protein
MSVARRERADPIDPVARAFARGFGVAGGERRAGLAVRGRVVLGRDRSVRRRRGAERLSDRSRGSGASRRQRPFVRTEHTPGPGRPVRVERPSESQRAARTNARNERVKRAGQDKLAKTSGSRQGRVGSAPMDANAFRGCASSTRCERCGNRGVRAARGPSVGPAGAWRVQAKALFHVNPGIVRPERLTQLGRRAQRAGPAAGRCAHDARCHQRSPGPNDRGVPTIAGSQQSLGLMTAPRLRAGANGWPIVRGRVPSGRTGQQDGSFRDGCRRSPRPQRARPRVDREGSWRPKARFDRGSLQGSAGDERSARAAV